MASTYIENQPYYATVVDQGFVTAKGKLHFIVKARLIGKTSNPSDPESDLTRDGVTPDEIEIWVDTAKDPEKLAFDVRDLVTLGWKVDPAAPDWDALNPRTPDFQSFAGKKTCVKCREYNGKFYWSLVATGRKMKSQEISPADLASKNAALKKAFDKLSGVKPAKKAVTEEVPF